MALLQHVGFFLVLSAVIVVMGTFYAESEDEAAFRTLPRRYGVFLLSCFGVTAVMLLCEFLFVAV